MACGFQTEAVVSVWWASWTTVGGLQYGIVLAAMFLLAVLVEVLRRANAWAHRTLLVAPSRYASWSPSRRLAAKAIRALLHLAHLLVGYLLMLAVMSYNLGVFCAVMAGFGIGYFLIAENHLPDHQSKSSPYRRIPSSDADPGSVNSDDTGLREPGLDSDEALSLVDATACH